MSFSITIKPSDEKFVAEASKSILESAIESGIDFPHGCKMGDCKRCECKVLSGLFETKNYLKKISNNDNSDLNILACRSYPLSDMVVEQVDLLIQKHIGKIVSMEKVADNVISLDIKLLSSRPFIFKEGQYIDIVLDRNIRRSYSISNSPRINNILNFHIRHFRGGYFTDKLFGYDSSRIFKINDLMNLEGPFGNFTLKKESCNPIIFLAGGTGFAPIKSMIEYILLFRKWRPIYLYWSVKNIKDMYMRDLIDSWIKTIPNLHYTPVVSNKLTTNYDWNGKVGDVHNVVMEDIPDMIEYEVYASGSPDIVELARINFISQCNLKCSNFFADPFYLYD
ncbi:CDP-4-dehydro-6-deoxyglucose reductase [Candidatus Kinetoplastibacterium blastocrithidii TCC012E]|uniref:CDP-4-dehydro-6-deoxyglucose reductase n=2 Tax=Candidatus Kinetoplastidibacterium blastocrithidiae TaxID=233181 RepID=M1MDN0_9PROT|nr:CDP-4-dehydro-6-deoxyglucose reductase [Candidatus Kinetoplastibacterium blastocrithidii (ex Strigomonas culicis)]AGF49830.1 CDP-4-dehydro-6-deoxyglucose reductase [Candidatus Kinetoplastibacterium blastocrithidii TCC012E]